MLDPLSGTYRNLGVASDFDVRSANDRVFLHVRELDQGGVDLNGDGDATDRVLHEWRPDGRLVNLGLSSELTQVVGSRLVLMVSEAKEGAQDFNGDGDATDLVLFTGLVGGPPPSYAGTTVSVVGGVGDTLLLSVSEVSAGFVDLNGDGDVDDQVLHRHDLVSGITTNLGAAIQAMPLAGASVMGVVVNECYANADFNFDGDLDDVVLGIYDDRTGALFNTLHSLAFANKYWFLERFDVRGSQVAFGALEAGDRVDHNGDGDTDDRVVFVYDSATGVMTNTGLAGFQRLGDDGLLVVAVNELQQGATDLNGDGDATDQVVFVTRLR